MQQSDFSLTEQIRKAAVVQLERQLGPGSKARLGKTGTKVYDVDGTPLLIRYPFTLATERSLDRSKCGYADITWHSALGSPLVGFATGGTWNQAKILDAARQEISSRAAKAEASPSAAAPSAPMTQPATAGGTPAPTGPVFGTAAPPPASPDVAMHLPRSLNKGRFIAYHYPYLAVTFDAPTAPPTLYINVAKPSEPVGVGALTADGLRTRSDLGLPLLTAVAPIREPNAKLFDLQVHPHAAALAADPTATAPTTVTAASGGAAATTTAGAGATGTAKTITGFTYDKEQIGVWCVPACIQMVLAYYHYHYTQRQVAIKLGLELARQEDLDATRMFEVLRAIQALSQNALSVEMSIFYQSSWTRITKEINENRPAVLLIGTHAQVIVGYQRVPNPGTYDTFRLIVVDPDRPGEHAYLDINHLSFSVVFYATLPTLEIQEPSAPGSGNASQANKANTSSPKRAADHASDAKAA